MRIAATRTEWAPDDGDRAQQRTLRTGAGETGTGIGLRNTRKRLELIYGNNARITIGNTNGMVETLVEFPINELTEGQAMA